MDPHVKPERVRPTRVYRFYRGGALIDRLRGEPEQDDELPEDWVGSVVEASTAAATSRSPACRDSRRAVAARRDPPAAGAVGRRRTCS